MGLLSIASKAKKAARAAGLLDDAVPPDAAVKAILRKPVDPGYERSLLADRYPLTLPGEQVTDPATGKTFVQKVASPEAEALRKERAKVQRELDAGRYKPFFPVEDRFYADPSKYPLQGNTLSQAVPKKESTAAKYRQQFDTPQARAKLQAGYDAAKGDPLARDWYAMGQLEQEFIRELGPVAGRQAFKQRFADAMAATTGGANPSDNLMMAHYGNFMRQQGLPIPAAAAGMPYPVAGRYVSGNMANYSKTADAGGLSAIDNPKRHNFSANFLGHRGPATVDEQMMGAFDPTLTAPPKGSYGIFENAIADQAAANGVPPVNFQDVAWAGLKGTRGKPMIQHVNEAIERTSRLTGVPPAEVVRRGLVRAQMPLYSAAPGLAVPGLMDDDYLGY